ncbi:MAG: hypothetical protein JNJ71_07175 [Rubrivivax sp.]|nr:hypothetical protein [Rubrivivax sp.]
MRHRRQGGPSLGVEPLWLGAVVGLLAAAVAATGVLMKGAGALFLFGAALVLAVLYTLGLRRQQLMSLLFAGSWVAVAALALVVLTSPASGALAPSLLLVLLLWLPSHFGSFAIVNRGSADPGRVVIVPGGGLPVERAGVWVHRAALLMVAASLLPAFHGAGALYGLLAVLAGGVLVSRTQELARQPHRRHALAAFHMSLVHLAILVAAVGLDRAFA